MEAEYGSLACTTVEILWLQTILRKFRVLQSKAPMIWCDNKSAVSLSSNPVLHLRTKHMELDVYFVEEKVIER